MELDAALAMELGAAPELGPAPELDAVPALDAAPALLDDAFRALMDPDDLRRQSGNDGDAAFAAVFRPQGMLSPGGALGGPPALTHAADPAPSALSV